MNPPEELDPIDALFRGNVTAVEDGGFTDRVMNGLPRPRRRWLGPAILLGAAAVGSALALIWVPWRNLPALDSSDLLTPNAQALLPWLYALSVAGSVAWGILVAATRP